MNLVKRIFIILIAPFLLPALTHGETNERHPVTITEWTVPWPETRPRDPYLDHHHRVWFVGQRGDYLGVLDPKVGQFHQFQLDPGTGPHNCIVDQEGMVWYAGNRAGHIGKLDPTTGTITKYPMPNDYASDPHTLVFGKRGEIWFTVQHGNMIGRLQMHSGSILLIPLLSQHALPYGIVMDATYTPWFTEFGANKLGTYDWTTKGVKEISLPRKEARPRRLALTTDGMVWYVDYVESILGRYDPKSHLVREWPAPGGALAWPYGMAVDDQDRVWFVETGLNPNRLVGFNTKKEKVISITNIKSGGETVRHMVYHQPTQTIWFGTDANTIARVTLP